MANGTYEIEDNDFLQLSVKQQNLMMFRTFNTHRVECDKRFKRLEERKNRDTLLSAGTGFIGGVTAVLVKVGLLNK